uniref:Uncharacterized protein n=1 Tax=Timema monikensis TaxID=170555 RepID=A0A7R9E5K9_9NEOP|nr:unnamed protein product [Timema monikensis]
MKVAGFLSLMRKCAVKIRKPDQTTQGRLTLTVTGPRDLVFVVLSQEESSHLQTRAHILRQDLQEQARALEQGTFSELLLSCVVLGSSSGSALTSCVVLGSSCGSALISCVVLGSSSGSALISCVVLGSSCGAM